MADSDDDVTGLPPEPAEEPFEHAAGPDLPPAGDEPGDFPEDVTEDAVTEDDL